MQLLNDVPFQFCNKDVSINGRGKLEVFSYTTSFAPPATKTYHSTLHVMKLLQSAVPFEILGMHITAETTCKSENTWKVLYKITGWFEARVVISNFSEWFKHISILVFCLYQPKLHCYLININHLNFL